MQPVISHSRTDAAARRKAGRWNGQTSVCGRNVRVIQIIQVKVMSFPFVFHHRFMFLGRHCSPLGPPATSSRSSSPCFSTDPPVINSLALLLHPHIIPRCFSFYKQKLNVHWSGPQAYLLSSTSFIPPPFCSPCPCSFPSLFLFSILFWPHPSFPIFPVNGLISFYPGARQINRYCIMAKTGKAPLCPWHLINGNPLICCL